MQQQQPPPPSKLPLNAITTQQIQKYLEDNKNLIMAILECQKLGKFQECARYQAVLQKNLMYLAAIADAQPPTPQTPNTSQVMQTPPSSIPQASNFMQQQPQQPGGGQKLVHLNSVHNQDQQQQLLHAQQQQQYQAQMAVRSGYQNGLFGLQSALGANAGGKQQGGSEVAYGGDGRGMFFDNGGYRDS